MAREQVLLLFVTLFVFICDSDLLSIDASKVVDAPICPQFAFTDYFPGFCAAHFISR